VVEAFLEVAGVKTTGRGGEESAAPVWLLEDWVELAEEEVGAHEGGGGFEFADGAFVGGAVVEEGAEGGLAVVQGPGKG